MFGWLACVSKPSSVTRTTPTPAGFAITWHAVRIAAPNAPCGNTVWNAWLPTSFAAASLTCRLDLADVRERAVAAFARRLRKSRATLERLRVRERDRTHAATGERAELVAADDHAVGRESRGSRRGGEGARQPAVVQILVAGCGRVPDLDRAEVRKVRRRVADALQDGESLRLPHRDERRERRMQARAIGQLHDAVARDRDARAQRVVRRIGVGHERVEPVVAALELDQHEQAPVARRLRCRGERDLDAAAGRRKQQRSRLREKPAAGRRFHHRLLHFSWNALSSSSRRSAPACVGSCSSGAAASIGNNSRRAKRFLLSARVTRQRSAPYSAVEGKLAHAALDRAAEAHAALARVVGGGDRVHGRAVVGSGLRTHRRRGRCVEAREPLEELLAREKRARVDPRFAAGPALDVRRREQVLAHAGCSDGERQAVGRRDAKLAQRADDQLDRTLHEHAAVLRREERVRSQKLAQRDLDRVVRAPKRVGDAL